MKAPDMTYFLAQLLFERSQPKEVATLLRSALQDHRLFLYRDEARALPKKIEAGGR